MPLLPNHTLSGPAQALPPRQLKLATIRLALLKHAFHEAVRRGVNLIGGGWRVTQNHHDRPWGLRADGGRRPPAARAIHGPGSGLGASESGSSPAAATAAVWQASGLYRRRTKQGR